MVIFVFLLFFVPPLNPIICIYSEKLHHSTNNPSKNYVKIRFIFFHYYSYMRIPTTTETSAFQEKRKRHKGQGIGNKEDAERGIQKYVSLWLLLSFIRTIIVERVCVYVPYWHNITQHKTTSPSTLRISQQLKHTKNKRDNYTYFVVFSFISIVWERTKIRDICRTCTAKHT